MSTIARRNRRTIDIWPGYVDALAALLMVVIFVLLVFVIAQAMLSRTVSQQDLQLASLHREIAELARQLGLAEEENEALQGKTNALSALISELMGEKLELDARFEELVSTNTGLQDQLIARDQMMAALQQDLGGLRAARAALEAETAALDEALAGSRSESTSLTMRLQQAQNDLAQRGVALDEERLISAAARAELALLNRQVLELRRRLEEIAQALAAAEAVKQQQSTEIEDLGKRLNIALAREVNRLSRYQSEFFGRLREVLGESPDIRVEGDRFVFSSELLFASGTADLGEQGRQQLLRFATTLRELEQRIPKDLDWVLRVDGHTDRVPIRNARYASNWELSTARAVSVVRFLIDQHLPPRRLVAAGFGENHPLDPGTSPAALARNRRIEFKLTSR
ncbi:MAG: peptidoglycan -binding protein [Gammaproteobacteria bacterium]|nr:MAG: peptidoglycan -binding protein [Gammaproteobacteria bacterium]